MNCLDCGVRRQCKMGTCHFDCSFAPISPHTTPTPPPPTFISPAPHFFLSLSSLIRPTADPSGPPIPQLSLGRLSDWKQSGLWWHNYPDPLASRRHHNQPLIRLLWASFTPLRRLIWASDGSERQARAVVRKGVGAARVVGCTPIPEHHNSAVNHRHLEFAQNLWCCGNHIFSCFFHSFFLLARLYFFVFL